MTRATEIPRPTLSRLPIYYRWLMRAIDEGESVISSQQLGELAGIPAAQVRKDLSHLGELGQAGVGYDTHKVAAVLCDFLGLMHEKQAIVVGAGNLGRALAGYPGFERYGLKIVALFDNDPSKIGRKIAGKEVFAVKRMADVAGRLEVRMGIVAVPAEQAQTVVDQMIDAGITVIWNFAPTHLQVPSSVLLENEDLAARLATISYYMTRSAAREP
ncbi:MAG: redox-sensing transcriptional repressor Rex [Chloroflexota bacterium]|nr:redox-sensing transcriptional repressor Rex [Chloroflexota bacterium]